MIVLSLLYCLYDEVRVLHLKRAYLYRFEDTTLISVGLMERDSDVFKRVPLECFF